MTISDEERELRRQAVAWHRGTHRLEGIEPPEPIRILEERYISGEIGEQEFRRGCFAFAQTLAKVPFKSWFPQAQVREQRLVLQPCAKAVPNEELEALLKKVARETSTPPRQGG